MLIESVMGLFVLGMVTLSAPRLVGREPTSLGKLKASMYLTLILILVSYISITIGIIRILGPDTGPAILIAAVAIVTLFGLVQWLLGPFIINLTYRAREPQTGREARVQAILENAARKAGMRKPPKLRIVDTRLPNAFAYGSPLMGSYVAVTSSLIDIMDDNEIEAVLGHELGHLKHRDVTWILALSIVPLALYFIGRSLIYASMFSGEDREQRESAVYYLAIGALLIALGIVTKLLVAHFNRLREYYADAFSTVRVGRGSELQRALAKIYVRLSSPAIRRSMPSLDVARALYIVAPLVEVSGGFFYHSDDRIVEMLKSEKVNPVEEIFSTHPPVPKRLRFIDSLIQREVRGLRYE